MSSTQPTFFEQFSPQPVPDQTPIIHTSNQGLAKAIVPSGPYGSSPVTIVFDKAIPDHQWLLFVGGRPIGPVRDITTEVGAEIRKTLSKLQGRR